MDVNHVEGVGTPSAKAARDLSIGDIIIVSNENSITYYQYVADVMDKTEPMGMLVVLTSSDRYTEVGSRYALTKKYLQMISTLTNDNSLAWSIRIVDPSDYE